MLRLLFTTAAVLCNGFHICRADAGGADDGDRRPADGVASDLIEWLRDNGAYINDKLEVGRLAPDDPSSPRGVFAAETLGAGETLCRIPANLVVKPSDGRPSEGDAWPHCSTIRAVADAMGGGGTTPYGRYLLSQPRDYAPGYWSEAGVDLLAYMLASAREHPLTENDELPPHGVEETAENLDCGGDLSDPHYRQAAMLVQARADYTFMVPFYDMFNHDNGKYNIRHKYTADEMYRSRIVEETGYEMLTARAIRTGEQLYNSYNRCNVCQEYFDWFGTPEMFLSFGFVEAMPQRWLFDFARTKFDLGWEDGDETTGRLAVDFLVPPSERGMGLLREEIARIESYATLHRRNKSHRDYEGVSEYEWEMLWDYYDALHNALLSAVRSNATLSDDVWKLGHDWWIKDGALRVDDIDHYVLPVVNKMALDDEL